MHKHEPSHGLGGLAPYSCMQMHALHGRQGKNNWCKAGRGEISTRTASIIYTVVDRRRFFNTGMLDRRLLLASGTTAHKWRSLACMYGCMKYGSIDRDPDAMRYYATLKLKMYAVRTDRTQWLRGRTGDLRVKQDHRTRAVKRPYWYWSVGKRPDRGKHAPIECRPWNCSYGAEFSSVCSRITV